MIAHDYRWLNNVPSPAWLNDVTAGDQTMPSLSRNRQGSWLTAWFDPSDGGTLFGRIVTGATPAAAFAINTTTAGSQSDADVAQITPGNFIVSFTDTSAGNPNIRLRYFNDAGQGLGGDFLAEPNSQSNIKSQVAPLDGGGFAVTWVRLNGLLNYDVRGRIYNQDGSFRAALTLSTPEHSERAPTVIVVGDTIVVGYARTGLDPRTNASVGFQRFSAVDGTALGSPVEVDGAGNNTDLQLLRLKSGFVVAYRDNSWEGSAYDVTVRVYNDDGTPRTGPIRGNDFDPATTVDTDGDQGLPSLTTVTDNHWMVGWRNADGGESASVYRNDGAFVTGSGLILGSVVEAELSGGYDGAFLVVRQSTGSDGDGTSIRWGRNMIRHDQLGDVTNNTFFADGFPGNIDGGDGVDTLTFGNSTSAVIVELGKGSSDNGVGGSLQIANLENVTGSAFADTLWGDGGVNGLTGGEGDDWLKGLGGNDLLRGGPGMDLIDGSEDFDTADYREKTGALLVTLNGAADATVSVNGVVEDTVRDIEAIYAGSGNDTLRGDILANYLNGGPGDDVLKGGRGRDVLDGGVGSDAADFRDKTASVVVTLNGATNATVTIGGVAEDTLRSVEQVLGGTAADTLTGDSLANQFRGGAGADVLTGGAGKDLFTYSALADSTVAEAGRDRITDFRRTDGDRIDLHLIDAVSGGGDSAFTLGLLAPGSPGRLQVTGGATAWLVQGDVDGDGAPDFAIAVTSTTAPTAADFVL